MRQFFLGTACLLLLASVSFAQTDRKGEGFVGYSNLQAEGIPDRNNPSSAFDDDFFDRRKGLHGVNAAGTWYFYSGLGLTGDFSFHRTEDSADFSGGRNSIDTRVIYFMGGPQFKFRNSGRVEPFARVLAGGAHTRFEVSSSQTTSTGTINNSFDTGKTDFAMAVGGGVDVRLSDRISIRAIQIDYTPIFLGDRSINVLGQTGAIQPFTLEGQRQDNIRISVGIVF
ncbi:MAG TPA: outer membrane beta-barrel protein [Blastocatellia bacterium]|nr:outer membrane beta-barrel protein [Blastocatellia bacterium]HMV87881.1 outer membrane beta-barrel protein [Blastocatellia bacterium]HMX29153.1 outer membrane beta-barrel protein [Blastocatellia bacterium]HMY72808.1 outer membrane beta-barrel protein [Blastocatellia bacterium]HMZ20178.1 outer membrane beta-barrel protein [Blastocatellia bacterium]